LISGVEDNNCDDNASDVEVDWNQAIQSSINADQFVERTHPVSSCFLLQRREVPYPLKVENHRKAEGDDDEQDCQKRIKRRSKLTPLEVTNTNESAHEYHDKAFFDHRDNWVPKHFISQCLTDFLDGRNLFAKREQSKHH